MPPSYQRQSSSGRARPSPRPPPPSSGQMGKTAPGALNDWLQREHRVGGRAFGQCQLGRGGRSVAAGGDDAEAMGAAGEAAEGEAAEAVGLDRALRLFLPDAVAVDVEEDARLARG